MHGGAKRPRGPRSAQRTQVTAGPRAHAAYDDDDDVRLGPSKGPSFAFSVVPSFCSFVCSAATGIAKFELYLRRVPSSSGFFATLKLELTRSSSSALPCLRAVEEAVAVAVVFSSLLLMPDSEWVWQAGAPPAYVQKVVG